MSGGFVISKCSDLLGKEPETTLQIKKVVPGKGKEKTRIPFVNFSVLNLKSGKFDFPFIRVTNVNLRYGISNLSEIDKESLDYTWDPKKFERKHRFSRTEAPDLVDFMNGQINNIQRSYVKELPDNADSIEKYFHRDETDSLESTKRDWPVKWRSSSTYDENTKKKGPGAPFVDQDGNPNKKVEVRFKFRGNPDDKWPEKFPFESFRGKIQETEFLDYNTMRLDGTKIVYDPIMVNGEHVNAFNMHEIFPWGAKIHEMDIYFKSGGYSNFDGGAPFLHIWVTRCVVEIPEKSDINNEASPEEIEKIKEIMKLREARAAASSTNTVTNNDDLSSSASAVLNNM